MDTPAHYLQILPKRMAKEVNLLMCRERDVEGNGAKAERPDRASSAAAANGRSSRSPHKGSRRPIDWAAYKRGRDADDLLPPERPPREAERSGRSDGKRSRRERSSSPSDS